MLSLQVIAPLLRSLAQLHNLNVLHRDIKPENIFFSSTGQLKLGDFGLAICTMSERPKSRVGTLDYMVRNQASGLHSLEGIRPFDLGRLHRVETGTNWLGMSAAGVGEGETNPDNGGGLSVRCEVLGGPGTKRRPLKPEALLMSSICQGPHISSRPWPSTFAAIDLGWGSNVSECSQSDYLVSFPGTRGNLPPQS